MKEKGFRPGFFFLCMLLALSFSTHGQALYQGVVWDAETGSPVQHAYLQRVDTLLFLTTTDSTGYFEFAGSLPFVDIYLGHLNYADTLVRLYPGRRDTLLWRRRPYELAVVDVTAASFLPALMRKSGGQTTLSPEMLSRTDGLSLATGLNLTPGVFMHSGALNTNRITIRGIGNRSPFGTAKIRAYLDDIPLTSGVGETTLEDLDLAMLQQVQVHKGPAPVHYGASLGGLIHLESLDPSAVSTLARMRLTGGDFGLFRQVYEWQDRTEDRQAAYNVQLHGLQSDGYRENNRYDRKGAALVGRFGSGTDQTWRIYLNYLDLYAQIPSSLSRQDWEEDPRQAAFTWAKAEGFEESEKLLAGLSFRQQLGPAWRIALSGSTQVRYAYERRPFNVLLEESRIFAGRAVLEFLPEQASWPLRLSGGVEPFQERYAWRTYETLDQGAGDLLSDQAESRTQWSGFVQGDWKLSRFWSLEGGVHLHQTRYLLTDRFVSDTVDRSGAYSFVPIWSPQLALRYRLEQSGASLEAYLLASRGFSTPTLEETLTPEGSLNPDLVPEKGWNLEIGASGWLGTSSLQYAVALFTMRVTDLLVARRTGLDQYIGVNAGSTLHQGVELQLDYRRSVKGLFPDNDHQVRGFVHYTYSGFRFLEFFDGSEDYSGRDLTGTPPHVFNAGLDARLSFKGVRPYMQSTFQWVDAIPANDANSVFTEPYRLVHVRLGVHWDFPRVPPLRVHGFWGMNNVADTRYAGMLQVNAQSFGNAEPRFFYPGLPRHLFGGLEVTWIFKTSSK